MASFEVLALSGGLISYPDIILPNWREPCYCKETVVGAADLNGAFFQEAVMHKLKLDQLRVETFVTMPQQARKGTVVGAEATGYSECTYTCGDACSDACSNMATCNTVQPRCTCYYECPHEN
jgi:hypothetical protein